MWRDMEEDAIRIGLDLHYFWSLTPKQWIKHIKVFNEKEKEKIKEKDIFNHMLGQYIGWAVNDPKNYPKKPFMEKEEKVKHSSIEEMEKMARINTLKMGGVINDS